MVSATSTVTNTHPADGADPAAPGSGDPQAPGEPAQAPGEPAPGQPGQPGRPGDPAAAAAGGGAALSNPFADPNFQVPTLEPLQGGTAGSNADRAQMEQVLNATINPPSAAEWTRALLDNSCRKVADPARAEMERSGYSLEQIEQAARMQEQAGQGVTLPKSEVSLSDVRVDGNRASATATVSNQNGQQSQTQIFEKEDGRWKLCN